jgi:hypothetical protein
MAFGWQEWSVLTPELGPLARRRQRIGQPLDNPVVSQFEFRLHLTQFDF